MIGYRLTFFLHSRPLLLALSVTSTDRLGSRYGQTKPTLSLRLDRMSTVDPTTSEDHLTTFIARELRSVRAAWDSLEGPPCPAWTWEDLKEALLTLAMTPL